MSFFKRLFQKQPIREEALDASTQQAVLIHLPYEGDDFPPPGGVEAMHELQHELDAVLEAANAGEVDGDEFGGGECTIYIYGPNADAIWAAIEPVLAQKTLFPGAFAIKQYDEDGDREERIQLTPGSDP